MGVGNGCGIDQSGGPRGGEEENDTLTIKMMIVIVNDLWIIHGPFLRSSSFEWVEWTTIGTVDETFTLQCLF